MRIRCAFILGTDFIFLSLFLGEGVGRELTVRAFIGLTGLTSPAQMTCTANLREENSFHSKKNQYSGRTGSRYQGNWARHSLKSK